MKSKYITTTLPYSNSRPHIGHAFEFIIGDALSRYFKSSGYDTFFNIGVDEHGLKIQQSADKNEVSPKQYVDKLLEEWVLFLDKLRIDTYDSFYRTSDSEHYVKVQQFWIEAFNRGDIYKKAYNGNYCIGCESFKNDRDLINNRCPDHPTSEIKLVEEDNYFFRLSKYKTQLLDWFTESANFIEPHQKSVELINLIENLEDISISRKSDTVSWGIPVPGDKNQTIYVWLDALLNYIFAAGYSEDERLFNKLWNEADVVQICGPDNTKFQAVILQSFLISAGIKNSDKLLVHGTILDSSGHKMSKSEGNVVDPIEQVEKYGVDAVRYYALAGISTYNNSSWDESRLVELYNSHLGDDYGNLVARITHLADKVIGDTRQGQVLFDYEYIKSSSVFCQNFDEQIEKNVQKNWDTYKIFEALSESNRLVKELNKYVSDEKPWENLNERSSIVFEVHYCLSQITKFYYPVIPGKCVEIKKALADCKKAIVFPKIEYK